MDYVSLVKNLASKSTEGVCVEFKVNNSDPKMIGENISALSNSALIHDETAAFIWGVEDKTHEIVGTTFDPEKKKIGAEELMFWLRKQVSNNLNYFFTSIAIDDKPIVILTITPPSFTPATFSNFPYIRLGRNTTLLSKMPHIEKKVWESLNRHTFELNPVKTDLSVSELEKYLTMRQS